MASTIKSKYTTVFKASSAAKQRKLLPIDYQLGDNDVYCGRGTLCFYHNGNQRFRDIVAANLPRYINATTKTEKSFIIYDIVDTIRETSPNGGFVKKDLATGRYMEVGDFLAVSTTNDCNFLISPDSKSSLIRNIYFCIDTFQI
jgi:hypothetical protein